MKRLIGAGALVLVLAGCAAKDTTIPTPLRGDNEAGGAYVPTTTTTTTASEPLKLLPEAKYFQLDVRILSKKCFGSAGCNLEYRIDVAYTGYLNSSNMKSATVTYRILGGEAEQINSFEILGGTGKVRVPQRESIMTPSSSSELSAEVIDVF